MRISTIGTFERGLGMMQELQAALDRTQRQISTGRSMLSPSDDPLLATKAVELRESLARIGQFERNADAATNRLSHEESALTSVNDVLQRVRELALQANNDSQSNETRTLIATELRERVDELVQIANQRDGTGRYLFGGNRDGQAPVAQNGGNYSYNGDQGQRLIQIGEGRQIPDGDSGSSVFFEIREGNGTFASEAAATNTGSGVVSTGAVTDAALYDRDTYSIDFTSPTAFEVRDSGGGLVASGGFADGDSIAFQGIEVSIEGQPQAGDSFTIRPSSNRDVFSSIHALADALEQPVVDDASRAALHNAVNGSLQNVDQALGKVLVVRTQIGTRLDAIDNQLDNNGEFALTVQETLSGIEDLDYAAALSRLSVQATTLEAAQQTFVRTQGLSLFNYL